VPGIHVFLCVQDVDGRYTLGRDDVRDARARYAVISLPSGNPD